MSVLEGESHLENSDSDDDDDDDEGALDLENLQKDKVAKRYIKKLLSGQQRQNSYNNKLQNKLAKLELDLDKQRLEVENIHRTLELERNRDKEEKTTAQKEMVAKAKVQEERIRDHVVEVLYQKPKRGDINNEGSSEFDTVVVSYIKPGQEFRYVLTFRVDEETRVSHVAQCACKYWDVEVEDFILKTMSNSKCQNDIKVKDCFKQGEIAQLSLQKKNQESTAVIEEELKAIQPKDKRGKRKFASAKGQPGYNHHAGVEKFKMFDDKGSQQLKKMGGVYFLLKRRELRPSEYRSKIFLRDIIAYTILAILTLVLYLENNPPGWAYWYMRGVEEAFNKKHILDVPSNAMYHNYIPGFNEVLTYDDMYYWLNTSLPSLLWNQTNRSLASRNKLVGYLSMRVQNIKEGKTRTSYCELGKKLVVKVPNITCSPVHITQSNEETSDNLGLKNYWDSINDVGDIKLRGPALPWKWMSAHDNYKNNAIGSVWGNVDTYSGAGYTVEYRMAASTPAKAQGSYVGFQEDMQQFRNTGWLSTNTRMIQLAFTVYNYAYDMWLDCEFLFELPGSGVVNKLHLIRSFHPVPSETARELILMYMSWIRFGIASYILFILAPVECNHKIKSRKAGFSYLRTMHGVVDMLIVATVFASMTWRLVVNKPGSVSDRLALLEDINQAKGFQASATFAFTQETLAVLDGIIFLLTMLRMFSFFRLNRQVYYCWQALGLAVQDYIFFLGIFIPVTLGFAFVAHKVWGPALTGFESLSSTILQLYRLTEGQLDLEALYQADPLWALLFVVTFYVVVTFVLTHAFTTTLISAQYAIQICERQPGSGWSKKKTLSWFLPNIVLRLVQATCLMQSKPSEGA